METLTRDEIAAMEKAANLRDALIVRLPAAWIPVTITTAGSLQAAVIVGK